MYIACQEVARLLLGEGADKEKAEKNGATPLLFVTCGHEEVARMLLGEGADKEKTSKYGSTPLLKACHREVAAR